MPDRVVVESWENVEPIVWKDFMQACNGHGSPLNCGRFEDIQPHQWMDLPQSGRPLPGRVQLREDQWIWEQRLQKNVGN